MPKAPRHTAGDGAATTVARAQVPPVEETMKGGAPATGDPWAAAANPVDDGWPADAALPSGPDGGVEPEEGAPVPAGGSEADGGAPVTQETPAEKPAPAAKKAAPPAKRARPTPVVAEPRGEMAGPSTGGLQLAALDETEEKLNGLWYGTEGTGKTTSIATAANHGRILVINAEGGLKLTPLRRRGVNTGNISIFPPPGRPELLTVDNLERLFWQVQAELHDDPDAWYAVAWDSVTEIVTKLLRDIVEREVAKNNALPEGSGKRKDYRESADFTDRSDYGVVSNQVLPLLRKYRDLPCHFLMTALERRDVDEDTGRVMYGPSTTPAIQNALLGYVDIAMRVQNMAGENDVEPHFVARTRPAKTTRAKDRFGVTPPVLENPTFERVHAYLTGELTYEPPAEEEASPAPAEPAKQTDKRQPAKKAAPAKTTDTKEN